MTPAPNSASDRRTTRVPSAVRRLLPLAAALAATLPQSGWSDELDTVQFRVGQGFTRDSNVLRIADSVNDQGWLRGAGRDDTVSLTTLGAKLDKRYGLQRFELDAELQRYAYQSYSSLDFTAFNYSAAWRWSLTPRLHGNIQKQQREYTDNLAETRAIGELNRRTDRQSGADAEYELGANWRVVGGVFDRSVKNSQLLTFENDTQVRGVEAGMRYVLPTGTALAYRYRLGNGEYPGRAASPWFATDFKDREHEFRGEWAPTGKSMVTARLSHLQRRHEGVPQRDFSGLSGQLDATLNATAKTSVTAGYVRELENYQTLTESYYTGNRIFVAPTYKPTEKTAVRVRYDWGQRDFKGAMPGFVASGRKDDRNTVSLAVEWEPIRALLVSATLGREKRKSTQFGQDYTSNTFGVSALARF